MVVVGFDNCCWQTISILFMSFKQRLLLGRSIQTILGTDLHQETRMDLHRQVESYFFTEDGVEQVCGQYKIWIIECGVLVGASNG